MGKYVFKYYDSKQKKECSISESEINIGTYYTNMVDMKNYCGGGGPRNTLEAAKEDIIKFLGYNPFYKQTTIFDFMEV